MEQNKTLLIILSVALFLAAILSVGLWFFYPREEVAGTPASVESAGVLAGDPIEWVRRNEIPALTQSGEEAKDDVIIVYGESPEEKIPEVSAPARSNSAAPYPPAVTSPPVRSPAVSTAPAVKKSPPPAPAAPRVAAAPRAADTGTKPATTPSAPAPAPKAAPPASAPKTVRVREFSIQVGAFSSRDRADELNEVLKEKGLSGQVFYADGPRLYRLRIGPYTNQSEAEKFLGWVRSIDGFQDSMIFERTATRTVVN
ncbi:MAG: SPOR domain-containing protein [Spirochaetales bacterium]|jgi:cell division septation protein DedD|nr:SPOR domain-containing protein [Spirochaetales bacterium]